METAMNAFIGLSQATRNARSRTGDTSIGTSIEAGQATVCRVRYDDKGNSTVTPIEGPMPITAAIEFLNAM